MLCYVHLNICSPLLNICNPLLGITIPMVKIHCSDSGTVIVLILSNSTGPKGTISITLSYSNIQP